MGASSLFVCKTLLWAHDTHTHTLQTCLLGQPDAEFPSPRHHTAYPGLRNGSKGQSLLPAPRTRWKGGQSAALSPCHGAVQGGDTCWGAQFAVYSPAAGFFSLPAAGNGNVSLLKVLSVLCRTLPWLVGFYCNSDLSSLGRDSAWI